MFQRNFADADWLAKRRTIVSNLLITYLTRSEGGALSQ
jgi:hypothetical protein